jgi:hypothetical protein
LNDFHPDPFRKLSVNLYDIYHCCVQWKPPEDGQKNCPKHVEFYSKNKFEKLMHLVGFILWIQYRNELFSGMLNSVPFLHGLRFWDTLLHISQNWHNGFVCSTCDTTVITWQFEGKAARADLQKTAIRETKR